MRRPLCLFCLTFAVILYPCIWFGNLAPLDFSMWEGQQIQLEGQVSQKEYRVINEEDTQVIYLKSVLLMQSNGNSPKNSIQGVMCYMKREEKYKEPPMGSRIRVSGRLMNFSEATNPGEFDMKSYYKTARLDFRLSDGVVIGSSSEYSRILDGLYKVRRYFASVIDEFFNKENAGVMKAMLLGEKGSLDKELKKLYQESGIIHILAISGLHISMLGMVAYNGMRKAGIPIAVSALISFVFIFSYILMTGIAASAIRAVIMFGLHLLAKMIGRTYDMLTALSVAALLILAEQPLYVTHTGFLFSFGAVLAIGLLLPLIKKEIPAAAGVSILLVTLPVHLYFYYQFPPYSIVLNLMIVPLMGIVMGSGLIVILLGEFFKGGSQMAAAVGEFILFLYEKASVISQKMPGSLLIIGQPTKIQIAVYGSILIFVVLAGKKIPKVVRWLFIIGALSILTYRSNDSLNITTIDVGQGDSIHIETRKGTHYLIDGGSTSKKEVEMYQIIPYLKSQGVAALEAVFVTHADLDHCSGVIALLEENSGIQINNLVLPKIAEESKNETYFRLEELAKHKKVPVVYMGRGDEIVEGDMRMACIHPREGYKAKGANEYSLVLLLEYKAFTALFTGDVEGVGEKEMMEYMEDNGKIKTKITLLKASHHGSEYSTDEEFLSATKPAITFISCAKKNSYGHPHKALLDRLMEVQTKVYITKDRGALRIVTDGKKVKVECFRE